MKVFQAEILKHFGGRMVSMAVIMLFLWSCGASRQNTDYGDESLDVDDLIGEQKDTQSKESDEAEVLKLLGITPDSGEVKTTEASVSGEAAKPVAEDLENDVEQLKQELLQKDREIYELRSELTKKEMKISELQAQPQATERTPATSGSRAKLSAVDFKTRYQHALDQFRAREYESAISVFRDLIASNPNHELADNCQYWIGECYYGLGNYNQAIAEFEKVFSYPNSNKNDDAQLKLGICYVKLGDKAQARAEFERLLSIYPDSEYRSLAQKYLARL